MNLIRKFINLQPGEGRPVLILFLQFFFYTAISITGKTARDSYFLSRYDKIYLPLMFAAVAIAVAIFIVFYTRITRQTTRVTAITGTGILFSVSLIAIQFHIRGWVIPFLYVWMDVIVVIMGLQIWGLAGEIFNSRQAKRLFSLLAAGGSLAAIAIGLGIMPFVSQFGSDYLLIATIVFILSTIITARRARRYVISSPSLSVKSKVAPKKARDFGPYLKTIAIVVSLSALVSTLVDYQFKMIASSTFPNQDQLATFFGIFYAFVGAATLILQLFVTSRILSQFGILVGLLILPITLIAGFTSFLIYPILISAFIGKFSDQTFKFTLHNTTTQLLWLPVAPAKKQRLKPYIDGTIKTIMEGMAGLFTFIAVKFIAIQYLSLFAITALIVWILSSFRLRSGYTGALMSAIEKRQLNFDELNLDITDRAMVETIERTLSSPEEGQQIFALELIQDLPLTAWEKTLNRLFHEGSPLVQEKILTLVVDSPTIVSDDEILKTIRSGDDLSLNATGIAGKRQLHQILSYLSEQLDSDNPRCQAVAAEAILSIDEGPIGEATNLLQSMLNDANENIQQIALDQLIDHPEIMTADDLVPFLTSRSTTVQHTALRLARQRQNQELIPAIIANLESSETAFQARRVLQFFPDDQVLRAILTACNDSHLSQPLKRGIIRTLKSYPSAISIDLLIEFLDHQDLTIFGESVDALLTIARQTDLPKTTLKRLDQETRFIAKIIYSHYNDLNLLLPHPDANLLSDHLQNEINKALPILLKFGVLDVPETSIETYIGYVLANDIQRLPFLLDLFESIYSKEERELVNPLVDNIALYERCKIGRRFFPELDTNLDQQLFIYITSSHMWLSAIALDFVLKTKRENVLHRLNWDRTLSSNLNREIIAYAVYQKHQLLPRKTFEQFKLDREKLNMYSTLEKTILLKSVSLFKSIPGEELSRVAQIAEEVQLPSDTPIFKEGDSGDSMFIVLDGQVRIHRGEKEIATLHKGDCLGEMALLDQEPRSADATVTEEVTLLKITQEGFYELMAGNTEIMHGIIKLLTDRLRKSIR